MAGRSSEEDSLDQLVAHLLGEVVSLGPASSPRITPTATAPSDAAAAADHTATTSASTLLRWPQGDSLPRVELRRTHAVPGVPVAVPSVPAASGSNLREGDKYLTATERDEDKLLAADENDSMIKLGVASHAQQPPGSRDPSAPAEAPPLPTIRKKTTPTASTPIVTTTATPIIATPTASPIITPTAATPTATPIASTVTPTVRRSTSPITTPTATTTAATLTVATPTIHKTTPTSSAGDAAITKLLSELSPPLTVNQPAGSDQSVIPPSSELPRNTDTAETPAPESSDLARSLKDESHHRRQPSAKAAEPIEMASEVRRTSCESAAGSLMDQFKALRLAVLTSTSELLSCVSGTWKRGESFRSKLTTIRS